MIKKILFCVETTKPADTDYQYIRETIRRFYEDNRKTVIRAVYMQSKSRYNSRAVQEDIKRESKGFNDTHVIYCLDTDNYDISPEDNELLTRIRKYCESCGYDFIFFCKDVEDVYCGERIPDTKKIPAIRQFKSTNAIENVKESSLQKDQYQVHCSNILNILDQYFVRKK